MSGSELLIMSVISFLTKCRRSPGIWRLTGAAYLVISHGAIRRRTASTSAADCFAPCGLALCIVTLVTQNLWKVPRIVNLAGHLTLAAARLDQSTVSVANLVHPPRRITSLAPVGTSLWISISHGHTRLCRAPGHPATPGPSVTWGKITAGTLLQSGDANVPQGGRIPGLIVPFTHRPYDSFHSSDFPQ
ncbi:hypothetical protein AMECASPLE_037174 [Ameca splendens]|uniref:Uncharacterized protein n=1 Tax=Ameca splendens TaxID=208324 RepID=A0ABV0XX25_9TELE